MVDLKGATVFLVCGGPSLDKFPTECLRRYGLLVAAVNNAPVPLWRRARVRPQFWFSADSPRNFHPDIFRDPSIIKFVRALHCQGDLHETEFDRDRWAASRTDVRRTQGGSWVAWKPATTFPNVHLYDLNEAGFNPETFLTDERPAWGIEGRRSVMLIALWHLARMGCGMINLLGCDFHMKARRPYAWEQQKIEYDCESANRTLHWLRDEAIPGLQREWSKSGITLQVLASTDLLDAVAEAEVADPFLKADGLYEPS